MQVACEIEEVETEHYQSGRLIPGVQATCSRCGHATTSSGTGEASIKRCLVLLREECPQGERNFYVAADDEHVDRRGTTAAPAPPIVSFRGENEFLSNFYACAVLFDGRAYPTAEHAFQAAKVGGSEEEIEVFRAEIRQASCPRKAKQLGRQVTLRRDWDVIKVSVMTQIVMVKFCTHAGLRRRLLATGNCDLIEGNTWGDRYWGAEWVADDTGKEQPVGENTLGKILMAVRGRLR